MSILYRILSLAVVLLLVCLAAADDVKLPDTDAGKRIAGFFEAINANDQQKAKAYIMENVAPAAREVHESWVPRM